MGGLVGAWPTADRLAPHQLALRCLADGRSTALWLLEKQVAAYPCRGADKLIKNLGGFDARRLLVVPDDDEIRSRLDLPHDATDERVIQALRRINPVAEVVLLKRNMESLLTAVRVVLRLPEGRRKPTPSERDHVLREMIAASPADRVQLLQLMPSFALIVAAIEKLLDQTP